MSINKCLHKKKTFSSCNRIGVRNCLLFTLDNGELRVYSIENDIADLSKHQSYQSINMHDNSNGIITTICQSCDRKFIFSAGYDGNIFMYEYQTDANIRKVINDFSLDIQLPASISDMYDPNELSLEMQMQRNVQLKYQEKISDKIQSKLEKLGDLSLEYFGVKKRNKQLPELVQYKRHEFVFDKRITDAFETYLRNEEQKMYREIEFDVEKSMIQVQKLKEYFIDVLEESIISVSAIRYGWRSLFHRYSKDFFLNNK